MDIRSVAQALLPRAASVLAEWFPQGKLRGREFVIGNLAGDPGDSLSFNTQTGVWSDFADGSKGGDLVALYAAIHRTGQREAALELARRYGLADEPAPVRAAASELYRPVKPNGHAAGFQGLHPSHGHPYALHSYRDATGEVLFFVARYHDPGPPRTKTFCPWTFDGAKWRPKAYPAPRPLYGLELLAAHPATTVLIVEGELKCDLARQLLNPKTQAVVVSWCGGAASYRHSDFSVLASRRVIIWPDADSPGRAAASAIAALLPSDDVLVIDTEGRPSGWDIADFISEGATSSAIFQFVREHAAALKKPARPPQQITSHAERQSVVPAPEAPPASADGATLPVFASQTQCWEYFGLAVGPGNRPYCNIDNVQRVLALDPQTRGRFSYDQFAARVLYDGKPWDADRDVNASTLTTMLMRERFLHQLKTAVVIEGVEAYAAQRRCHPVRAFLDALQPPTPGTLERLFVDGYGAADNAYTRAAARVFLCSAVHRILSPGEFVRQLIVLEGSQGAGKTQSLHDLFDPWMLEASRKLDSKDFDQDLQGHWCVELAELASVIKSDPESVKAVLTRRDDYFRASYGRRGASHPRQCIFVGTTNSCTWQIDSTGGTRYLPIACGTIDRAWIRTHRAALFSEALALVRSSADWWRMPEELAAAEQDARYVGEAWDDIISEWLCDRTEAKPNDIAEFALKLDPKDRHSGTWRRLAESMCRLGYHSVSTKRDNKPTRLWLKINRHATDSSHRSATDEFP
jgi:hypothetical protein